jgi:hypothetical protein
MGWEHPVVVEERPVDVARDEADHGRSAGEWRMDGG